MSQNEASTTGAPGFFRTWWVAIRPYSLPASTMSVVFGTAMAVTIGGADLHPLRFAAAFLGMALLQCGANLMNDVFDFKKGLDTRVNPVSGAVVRGWITPRQGAVASALFFVLGSGAGLWLVAEVGTPVLIIGLVGLVIGLLYSLGPVGLKYHGLGDLAVFVDFGILGALGAWTIQTGEPSWVPAVWAIPLSILVIGILHANNWRDIAGDRAGGIRTVASVIGDRASEVYYGFLLFGPFAAILGIIGASWLAGAGPRMPLTFLVTLLALPLAVRLMRKARARAGAANPLDFLALDGATARLNMVFGLLCTGALGLFAMCGCGGTVDGAVETRPSAAADGEAAGDYAYMGWQRCEKCHPDQAKHWRHSLHALAHFEPVYDVYFVKASLDSGQELETYCAACHTPIGIHQGEIPFAAAPRKGGDTKVSPVATEGLTCDFCHTITGFTKLENSGYATAPSMTKHGPLDVRKAAFHKSQQNPLFASSDLCGTCHNVNHPVNGIVLEATYTEWKNSPYAAEGVSCQDCHMTEGLTGAAVHPGKAATTGPDRPHVSRHYFVGPNVIFGGEEGAAPLRDLSLELLERAGKIEIGPARGTDDGVELDILVTNTGAGHYLPTGITEIREMWIDLAVFDATGTRVFASGALDAAGGLAEGAVLYHTWVKDAAGAITTQFWNTVEKVRDHRVPPRETVTETYRLPVKAKAVAWPLKVEASLRYRSASPAGLAEVGAPADLVEIPVLTISSATGVIKGL